MDIKAEDPNKFDIVDMMLRAEPKLTLEEVRIAADLHPDDVRSNFTKSDGVRCIFILRCRTRDDIFSALVVVVLVGALS